MRLFQLFSALLLLTGSAHAAELTGQVVGWEKGTLAEHEVMLSRLVTGHRPLVVASTATDSNGRYVFSNITPGKYYMVSTEFGGTVYRKAVMPPGKLDFNFSGRLEGTVSHKDKPLNNITVALEDDYGRLTETRAVNGSFVFEYVDIGNYTVSLDYQGVPYNAKSGTGGHVDFSVFNATASDDGMRVASDSVVISFNEGSAVVEENITFENSEDEVFFNKDGSFLSIPVPVGMRDLKVEVMECCLVKEAGMVRIDTMEPVMPGNTFTTKLSYRMEPFSFERELAYDTASFTVYADRDSGMRVLDNSSRDVWFQGKKYDAVIFNGLSRGENLKLRFALPKSQIVKPEYVIIGSAILALLLVFRKTVLRVLRLNKKSLHELEAERKMVLETLDELVKKPDGGSLEYELLIAEYMERAKNITKKIEEYRDETR